jgi:endonuclease/exonuclease/phosphatase family metal-dependent hydrolase
MNRILKYSFLSLLAFLFFIIGFYFWASSSKFEHTEYAKIEQFNFPTHTNNDTIFSIITYNIGYLSGMTNNLAVEKPKHLFDNNLSHVLKQFEKYNADILAFQEIDYASKRSFYINQQNEIAKIGYNHVAQSINWDKNYVPFPEFPIHLHFGRILSGQSILSKYNILSHERIPLERNGTNPFYYDAFYLDRLAQVVKINIRNKTLVLIHVHLEAYHAETRRKQTQKIIQIFNQYRDKFPTILLGDFNSDTKYENASIHLLLNLPKIGNAVYLEKDNFKTFSSEKPTERLDYIFYNTNFIDYLDGIVLSDFGQASDHLPLKMNFKFK